jgi:hypothetical protein
MTNEQFWTVIADSRQGFDPKRRDGNMDLQAQRLEEILSELPPAEVADFERIFTEHHNAAYRWDLWGAAYIIEGGCSDDGFTDFRYWLISMGREIFEAALANPESLAKVADGPGIEVCSFEEFGYIARRVLEDAGAPEAEAPASPQEPAGEQWEEDDLPERFPKLWAKFGE